MTTAVPATVSSARGQLPRLKGVDALRAVAALLVLLLHTGRDTGPLVVLKPVASFGWSGVGLFLVISGFSIHFRWAASDVPHHDFTTARFFRRRFFRLYPTYLCAAVLTALLLVALGESLGPRTPWVFTDGYLPGWVLALSTLDVVTANAVPVAYIGVAWSLGLEAQLYVLYSLLIRRLRRIGVTKVVTAILVVALAYRLGSELVTSSMPVGQFFPGGRATALSRLLYAQLPSRAFEWFLGVLAAEAYFGRMRLPNWTRSPSVAIAFLVLSGALFRHPHGVAYLNGHFFRVSDVLLDPLIGLGYFVLLRAVLQHERRLAEGRLSGAALRAFAAVGVFSYSLYLLHPVLLTVGDRLAGKVHVAGAVETLAVWVFVLAGASAFHSAIERPFMTGSGDQWIARRWRALRGLPTIEPA